jgi:hypothetical protein
LRIGFECGACGDDEFTLMRDIHRWSYRVEYIYLDIGDRDIRLLGLDSANFPLLKGATLGCNQEPLPSVDLSENVFGNAPQLHELHMTSWGFTPTTFTLTWLQLTKFEGALLDLELFTLAPDLAELIWTFHNFSSLAMIVTHHRLRRLTIKDENPDNIIHTSLFRFYNP